MRTRELDARRVQVEAWQATRACTRIGFLDALSRDPALRADLTRLIAGRPWPALFLEFPALSTATGEKPAEFRLVRGDALQSMTPEPQAFAEWFEPGSADPVARFRSLGGDATLLAPHPVPPFDRRPEAAVHLAAFCRHATAAHCDALWRATAVTALGHLDADPSPRWLSTSGLGVGWLHVRLDSRPKYYTQADYREPTR
jgi:hypothetical protein